MKVLEQYHIPVLTFAKKTIIVSLNDTTNERERLWIQKISQSIW